MKMTDEERYTCLINIEKNLGEQMLNEHDNDKCRELHKQRITINYIKDEMIMKLLIDGITPKDIDVDHLSKRTIKGVAEILGLDISHYYNPSIENYTLVAVNLIKSQLKI